MPENTAIAAIMHNVRERPILFSGPMVRALLAGTKTQTRRAVKLPHMNPLGVWEPGTMGGQSTRTRSGETVPEHPVLGHSRTGDIVGPRWWAGDRLWVRESTRSYYLPNILTGEPTTALGGQYVADDAPVLNEHGFDWAWWYSKPACPSIHMPRWASRTLLEVTEVRVQRLQDISEDDAIAEGCITEEVVSGYDGSIIKVPAEIPHPSGVGAQGWDCARDWYADLWENINGPDRWDANPWVWAVSFKRITP